MAKAIDHLKWDLVCKTYIECKSVRKTAAIVGMSKNGVAYILKQRNVQMYARNRGGMENSIVKSLDPNSASGMIRNIDLMERLYVIERKSTKQIARMFGVSTSSVFYALRLIGIKCRTVSESLIGIQRPKGWKKIGEWRWGVAASLARRRLRTTFVNPILRRDGFACTRCRRNNTLQVHHLRSFSSILRAAVDSTKSTNPNTIVEIVVRDHSLSDGVTLCKRCHQIEHIRLRSIDRETDDM